MIQLEQKPGRTAIINGKEYLFFSGYSYLGLGCNQEFLELIKKGIDTYGVVYPSSRISNTPLHIYSELEQALASLTSTEESAVFSSGFLSARTAVEVVAEEMNIYYRPPAHPASSHHAKAIAVHQAWDDFLMERSAACEFEFGWMADSINPTPGHINDFSFLENLPPAFRITLILDDSHGIGWLGSNGEGIVSLLSLPAHVDLIVHFSLSKAFHLNAGAICGAGKWIGKIKNHVNFTTSTPPMPALAFAFLHAREIMRQQRKTLHENISFLKELAKKSNRITNEATPVFLIHIKGIEPQLLQNNVIISSFGYPHPTDEPINRVVVNALHQPSDLEKLLHLLHRF